MFQLFKLKTVLSLALILALFLPGTVMASQPRVTSAAAVLMDVESGQIYFAKNHTRRAEPASLTKIMTAVVALENGNLQDIVTVGGRSAAVSMGSIIDLRKGEKIALEELIKAALVCSANDSTVAIAEHVGQNEDRFLKMMNTKAKALGMFGTRYENTNGYHDPNHYTTALDLAVLTKYALGQPKFNELVQTRETTVHWVKPPDREEKLRNCNRLLHSGYQGVDGVKTGTTPMAGNCLIASATRDGRRLIAVTLNSYNRYEDCKKMFDYGFEVVKPATVLSAGEAAAKTPVTGGTVLEVEAVAEKDLVIRFDPEEQPKLVKKVELKEAQAPVKKGQQLGEVTYTLQGQELGRVNLVAGADIPRKGWHQLWDKMH